METSSRKWQPIYFTIFSITIVAAIVGTALLDRCAGCSSWFGWVELVESSTTKGILYATALISTIEVMRMVMLPADYLRQKFIEPLKQRQRDEGRAEGRDEGRVEGRTEGRVEGRAEGHAEGKVEGRAEVLDWLERKEAAEREGREFNEPVPGTAENGNANRNGSASKG